MRLIITGGGGFIGSNLTLQWLAECPNDKILNLDKLTYASNLEYLAPVQNSPAYEFCKTDLINRREVRDIIRAFRPEGVVHLAAESHVDNSIRGPEEFVLTNVVGTFNLLEECRQYWNENSSNFANYRFLHVSTDEVFGSLSEDGVFTEKSPYSPRSPYSATKAGSDHLAQAYFHTYGMNVVVTNCSNNYGPRQHPEKFIPTIIRSAIRGEDIPVYGKGNNIRDWIYVEDHCRGLRIAFEKGVAGESYCFGARNEWKNIELVEKICAILNEKVGKSPHGDYRKQISFVSDRLGHDFRYAIAPSKAERELGWKASTSFEQSLRTTIDWYLERLL